MPKTLMKSWRLGSSGVRLYQTMEIEAAPRYRAGAKRSSKLRMIGRIPTLVQGSSQRGEEHTIPASSPSSSPRLLLTTSEKQIVSLINDVPYFFSTTFLLRVHAAVGSSHVLLKGTVLPTKVQRDEHGRILNVIFEWAEKGSKVKVDVPLVFKGEDVCPGLLKGGHLQKMKTTLMCLCPVEYLPTEFEVDLTYKDIGDMVSSSDISIPSSIKVFNESESAPISRIVAAQYR